MTPVFSDEWIAVYAGDCRAVMAELQAGSVHMVVTSPPYWGLRDYGADGQIGLEPTPEAYVETMVAVFREVRRVLRDDGTVWLNLGDSYAGSWGAQSRETTPDGISARQVEAHPKRTRTGSWVNGRADLKPKDLVGIPWRVAFALQADGWYLRSDVVWSKPNPMPESVTDRPTKSHEYVFLLSKRERYYFDADAVREAYTGHDQGTNGHGAHNKDAAEPHRPSVLNTLKRNDGTGRNLRSVWTIATQPYPGAHFATFPEALVEPCVKAGTSERGVCPDCGAPWVRVVERGQRFDPATYAHRFSKEDATATLRHDVRGTLDVSNGQEHARWKAAHPDITTGWRASCRHDAEPVPATVLDLFAGSGTTGRVAQRLGRRAVLVDLSPVYLLQALKRNGHGPDEVGTEPLFSQPAIWGEP